MSESSQPYRIDGPVDIEEDKLLFWPNNPRLKISDFKELKLTFDQLVDPNNQNIIFNKLRENEHGVDTLMNSMMVAGFMREKAPIVIGIKGGRYMVLEGNRRLTSVRTLLHHSNKSLPKNVEQTLRKIPCWIFVHTSKNIPLKTAISRLIAEHHLKGQKEHTKIQQAHLVYDAYMGFLDEKHGLKKFVVLPEMITLAAEFFIMSKQEVERELAVYRIYQQLTESGYEVDHKLRERFTWIFDNPRHFKRNFGYCEKQFNLTSVGLEGYYDIFIKEDCAIHNPQKFKKFVIIMQHVFKTNDSSPIEHIRENPEDLELVFDEIEEQKSDQKFLEELGRIERKLSGLKLNDYNETSEEVFKIRRIVKLVDQKLKKLAEIEARPQLTDHLPEQDAKRAAAEQAELAPDHNSKASKENPAAKKNPPKAKAPDKKATVMELTLGIRLGDVIDDENTFEYRGEQYCYADYVISNRMNYNMFNFEISCDQTAYIFQKYECWTKQSWASVQAVRGHKFQYTYSSSLTKIRIASEFVPGFKPITVSIYAGK